MKLLVYYLVAENRVSTLMHTLAVQATILPGWGKVEKLFVIDRGVTERMPGDRVVRMNLFSPSGLFLFSKAKNAAIEYAVAHQFDWLLDCDADTVLLRLPKEMPPTGYGCVPCHFVKQGAGLFVYNGEDIIPTSSSREARASSQAAPSSRSTDTSRATAARTSTITRTCSRTMASTRARPMPAASTSGIRRLTGR